MLLKTTNFQPVTLITLVTCAQYYNPRKGTLLFLVAHINQDTVESLHLPKKNKEGKEAECQGIGWGLKALRTQKSFSKTEIIQDPNINVFLVQMGGVRTETITFPEM